MIGDRPKAADNSSLRHACHELSRRLRSGQDCCAEDFFAADALLATDVDSALELVYTEFAVREEIGERPQPDQWLSRFPQWRDELEKVFEVHQLVADGATRGFSRSGTLNQGSLRTDDGGDGVAPRAFASGYELLGEIGRGGMGVVYEARQRGLGRLVALKTIIARHEPRERARFRTEAEATARLSHPNVVQIYEVGEEAGIPFLSMELVTGAGLDKQLADSPLGARAAAELMLAVARGVAHAHHHGIIHRDLKPANILMAQDGTPKITDFGLARQILPADSLNTPHSGLTQSGAIVGTPCYMAPEQCRGISAQAGPAADVYSLGAILYEALTGRPPFRGETALDTLELVRSQEPVPPRRLVPKIPRDLETICLKCLAKQPHQRYPSAAELADDLGRFLSGDPIAARRVTAIERAWRLVRRHPLASSLVACLTFVFLAGISGILWQSRRADDYARQAQTNAEQERAARQLAEYGFGQAEEAVGDYLDGIENNERLKEADFLDLRKQLLASALPFYEDFVRQKPGEPSLRAKHGRAYERLGALRGQLGEWELSLADYQQARSIFQELAAVFPEIAEHRWRLARASDGMGGALSKLGRKQDAQREHRQALALLERLAAEFPNNTTYRSELAVAHNNLGTVFRTGGNYSAAAQEFRRAIQLRQSLLDQHPDVPSYRLGLAHNHNNLAAALNSLGNSEQAEAEYRQAIRLKSDLVAAFPNVHEYRHSLATTHDNLGNLLLGRSQFSEAESEYNTALAMQQPLAERFPATPEYRNLVSSIYYNRGLARNGMRKFKDARSDYEASLKIRTQLVEQHPNATQYRSDLGKVLSNLAGILTRDGELDEARRMYSTAIEQQLQACRSVPEHPDYLLSLSNHYRGLAEVSLRQKDHIAGAAAALAHAQVRPDVADDAYRAAIFLGRSIMLAEQDQHLSAAARSSAAQEYTEQAIQHLREAVRRGFSSAKAISTAEALAPLRDRPDFQELVRKLGCR